jgi:hypothetical protein
LAAPLGPDAALSVATRAADRSESGCAAIPLRSAAAEENAADGAGGRSAATAERAGDAGAPLDASAVPADAGAAGTLTFLLQSLQRIVLPPNSGVPR